VNPASAVMPPNEVGAEQHDSAALPKSERDTLVVTSRVVDGHVVVVSRYGDTRWSTVGHPTNKPRGDRSMNFARVPEAFRETMKAILYRYMRRGREGQRRPSDRAAVKLLKDADPFLKHLEGLGIVRLADVTPQVCWSFVEACRRYRQCTPHLGKSLKASSLGHRLCVVEASMS
jgi:hypothetical protein